MISKGPKKGTIRFSLTPQIGVRTVQVAGDFNDWNPQPMRKQKSGQYVAICPVNGTGSEYKFLVDGDWAVDPDNNCWARNPFGTVNSVVQLED
ncbi:MAG: isoamylase early set domain-containing protein [Phycisphaerae bacterium]